MAYCGPAGIPHSHFLGGPLVWTAADRDKALEWQQAEAQKCSRCLTDPSEWAVDPNAYVYGPVVCPGCARQSKAEAQMHADHPEDPPGMYLSRRRA